VDRIWTVVRTGVVVRMQRRVDDDNPLRYADDLAGCIKAAHQKGLSNEKIIRELTRGATAAEVRAVAQKWAAALGLSVADFVRLAGPRSTPRRGS